MPEYLAPGVYVEEVSSGNKPIEGVSTSTAGVVGFTQRGPVNQPTLVTSRGEFHRVFGGRLDHRVFTNGLDALPYAVEGFFQNNGSRIYVTRIVGTDATRAEADIYALPPTDRAHSRINQQAPEESATLLIDASNNIAGEDTLLIQDDARSEYVTVSGSSSAGIRLSYPLRADASGGDTVNLQTITEDDDFSSAITADMTAGGGLELNEATVNSLGSGDILRLRDTVNPEHTEYVTISTDGEAGFDEGTLQFPHPEGRTEVHRITTADEGTSQTLSSAVNEGNATLRLDDTSGLSADVAVTINSNLYHLAALVDEVSLAESTRFVHSAGVLVIKQVAVLRAHAHYPGVWGNALRAKIRPSSILHTRVADAAGTGDTPIRLEAVFGINTGTVLEFSRNGEVILVQRVVNINRAANEVSFADGIDAAVQAGDQVRSLEFTLVVEHWEDDRVAESEAFDYLALDPEHPRYAPRIVGSLNRSTGRASRSGASELVRLSDLSFEDDGVTEVDNAADLRLADPYADVVHRMEDGSDDIGSIDESTYIGDPSDDPDDRTGIYTLANRDDISLVAVPGQTGINVQKALLGHCENMKYRFAILDSEPGAKLDRVQTHRQNYDSTRGAYYYPWLVISDPFGEQGDLLSIPPSGHVLGLIARTDVERGVHKAPANEVVRGIREFEKALNKAEQDILNPLHINCFRDFRPANRGLRLYGARTLSSDPEWKYVNVRRLFLFLEKSIENGMQFAVFEPNSEGLWATVKRSLTNFLITVWRSGALEGTTQEEAFFVNVGLDTMTQADIDNGRLIVEVAVAPVKPAEFVIFRISQKTREATS